jgi:hypothetical protein
MAAERVRIVDHGNQSFDAGPQGILYLRIERAHDGDTSTWSLVVGSRTPSLLGPPPRPVDVSVLAQGLNHLVGRAAAYPLLRGEVLLRAAGTTPGVQCFGEQPAAL